MKGKNIIKERPPNTSKNIVKYGKTLRELAVLFGVSKSTIFNWVNDPEKEKWMGQKLKENSQQEDR